MGNASEHVQIALFKPLSNCSLASIPLLMKEQCFLQGRQQGSHRSEPRTLSFVGIKDHLCSILITVQKFVYGVLQEQALPLAVHLLLWFDFLLDVSAAILIRVPGASAGLPGIAALYPVSRAQSAKPGKERG